jgi:predicted DNA-binding transcriptional regulator AlpA
MAGGAPGIPEMSAIGRAVETMRRTGPSDRTGSESSRPGRPEPVALGNASRNRASAAGGDSVVSGDDASPDAVNDLLTNAQLAARWQLSRGTLANQRSQGRGPAYLKLAGRVRYRRSDIEAYEQAGLVSREPGRTTTFGDPSDGRETVARLIRSLGS